jgi:integrase
MGRKVRASDLETRTARSRLQVQHKPYFRLIEPGLHLGYRKLASGPGTWVVRRYAGSGKYSVKNLTTADGVLVIADDYSEPDDDGVLSFGQAQVKALRPGKRTGQGGAETDGPYTVGDAMDDYLKWLETEGRSTAAIEDATYRADAFIRPKLGDREIEGLTAQDLRNWRNAVAKSQPRIRTSKKPGKKQQYRKVAAEATEEKLEDDRRARRSTANRTWTVLRAALNHAFREGEVESDIAWRKVKPFKGVDKARVRYIEVANAQRLVNATDADFRLMVQAALLTGARYGQLARLVVADFNRDAGTVRMTSRKGDGTKKVYHVHLTEEGARFFKQACLGRSDADALIFRKADDSAWQKSDQARPMKEASKRANINPAVNFHCLRHTYASLTVMNGTSLLVVAKNLGHSDTRMVEGHYGHLAPSYVAEEIRKGAPKFGFEPNRRVVPLKT